MEKALILEPNTTYYAVLLDDAGLAYRVDGTAFEGLDTGPRINYAASIGLSNAWGRYDFIMPANMPVRIGVYDALIFQRLLALPDPGDPAVAQREVEWDGLNDLEVTLTRTVSQNAGTGDIPVNHDTGGPDNLRYLVDGIGQDGADVRAYLKADYDLGRAESDFIQGQTQTTTVDGITGRIRDPMFLLAGNTYTITFNMPGVSETDTAEITI